MTSAMPYRACAASLTASAADASSRSGIPIADVLAAIAEYDAVVRDCPANRYHLGDQKCPKCGAMASDDCWPSNRAADRFVRAIKDMLK